MARPIYADIGLKQKIPVSFMGDGIARLLTFSLAIATNRGGVVFIDEIENGIHYSVMKNIWKALSEALLKFNCQLIATTHSYECVESAYKAVEENKNIDLSYVRLDKKGDKISGKEFSGETLSQALKSELEVR